MDNRAKLMRAAMTSDEVFSETLRQVLSDMGMTIKEFSASSEISSSTLYKVISGQRSPSMDVLRRILLAVSRIDGSGTGEFIAVIAARHVMAGVVERSITIDGKEVLTKEYPATTLEDALVASVRAERDGAKAIVCAPIVSATIERVVDIPIATIMPRDSVTEAIKLAAKKSGT